jgi:hypothetical protein
MSNNQSPVGQQPRVEQRPAILLFSRSMEQKYIISTKIVDFYKNIFFGLKFCRELTISQAYFPERRGLIS